jgi:hypothetical protein
MTDAVKPPGLSSDRNDKGCLTPAWQRWQVENLMLAIPEDAIVAAMAANGFDPEEMRAELRYAAAHPFVVAGGWIAQRLKKLESILEMTHSLRSLAPEGNMVPRRSGLSRQDFLSEFYSQNRPVILEDVASDWPALRSWTPETLRSELGDVPVEIMAGRDKDPKYEINIEAHRRQIAFSEYVDLVLANPVTNDIYMVANNHVFEGPAGDRLWQDISLDGRYLEPVRKPELTFLWFGPRGTITPLHHDEFNILFAQVIGRKHFTLISPLLTHRLGNDVGVFSELDPTNPDLQRFPRYEGITPMEFELAPGDALFIPAGWWHRVQSLDVSVSVSFGSFVFPNSFTWFQPSINR